MARHSPLPRFRLDTDSISEQNNNSNVRATSASPNMSQTNSNQRSQIRIRRSACSDLQNTTIPEERIYHGNRRRASLFVGRTPKLTNNIKNNISTDNHQESSEGDYIKLCRQRCQSLYKTLANKTLPINTKKESFQSNDHKNPITTTTTTNNNNNKDDVEDDDDEINFKIPPRTKYRYSLPDASPAALALRNILKRNKTTKYNHLRIGLPTHSSHSLPSSIATNSSSTISTFRNFLSLVKSPSTKSINSTTSHHSSLTALTNTTGGSSTTLDQTTSSIPPTKQWHFEEDKSQWCSSDGISKIILGSIELHNLTYAEHKHLKQIILQRLQSSQYDLGVSIHVPGEEPARKRKHHFMFRSKSSDKSKEGKDTKSNGNVFGVALSQCVNDDDFRFQDDVVFTSGAIASGINRKDSTDMIGIVANEGRTSPSGSISSTNDSGCSVSPASPSSLQISEYDYETTKFRSVSLEALGPNEAAGGISRMNTLRCYPAKVPELIKNCCDYLEKNALQTVGLFRVGVSKKRLKELKDQVNLNRNLTFDSSTNAHDIAGLIKEFLRELPEPLLTRDLCGPFLNVRTKLNIKDQSRALSYLISLLPSSNRDTLYTLLKFLHNVSLNSQDRYSIDGKILVAGNKMDAANLAIVFAPTILMDCKAPVISSKDMSVAMSADQMEQGKSILKLMIEQYKELFTVPKDLHNEICVALYERDSIHLMRALAFKIQNGCGISSMQLDETNENLFMSLDITPILYEIPTSTTSIFSAIIPRINQQQQQQLTDSMPRRYNGRRNSDFPCTSTHASRSSEFLQVPILSSQQRRINNNQSSSIKSLGIRDIREASMDQIIFRLIDPPKSSQLLQRPTEPIINISSFDDVITSSVIRPNSLDIKESPSSPTTTQRTTATALTTSNPPLLRELKPYARSKTAPLSSVSGAQQFLTPKRCEARDLCGSSSNDDSPSPTTGHNSTLV
ncbi:unnamed protein product [Rotaria sp. Silwood1]|nr:unnamed protein product [Rotaria sp. Silwood1]CAF1614736.1 unnamed protein product [Rotaria sp. Silwood1]